MDLIIRHDKVTFVKNLQILVFGFLLLILAINIKAAPNEMSKHDIKALHKNKAEVITEPAGEKQNTFYHALFAGKWMLAFRARYERVAQDNSLETAEAHTLRTLLGYQTGKYAGLSAFIQFEGVTGLGRQTYNSGAGTSPSRTQYSVIPDPNVALLNQAYLNFDTIWKTRLRIGRQIITLDNQRFVGPAPFRQNDQTFDAAVLQNRYFPGLAVFYAHVIAVNRIFGPGATNNQGRQQNNTNLFNISYAGWRYGKLIAYFYSIDNPDASSFSTNTYGLRFHGMAVINKLAFIYTLEYARQNNAFNNTVDYAAFYTHIAFAIKLPDVLLRADQEILSGDGNVSGKAFRTPLASLYKFQGWNDVFITTPDAGIIDSYITAKVTIEPWYNIVFTLIGHDFSTEASKVHLGSEIDTMLSKTWVRKYTVSLAYGNFHATSAPYVDTEKLWLTFAAHFSL